MSMLGVFFLWLSTSDPNDITLPSVLLVALSLTVVVLSREYSCRRVVKYLVFVILLPIPIPMSISISLPLFVDSTLS